MPYRAARLAMVTLLGLAATAGRADAQSGGAPAQPASNRTSSATSRDADAQAIRALSQQWLAAERRKDVAAVMAMYAPDAVAVYGGALLTGTDAIRRDLEHALNSSERPNYVPSFQTTTVEVAQSGDLAYEWGTYDDSWNGGTGRERGQYLTVWRKVGDQWKVVRDMATPIAKPAP